MIPKLFLLRPLKKGAALLASLLLLSLISIQAQNINPREIDDLVERSLKAFNVPGIAISLVKDGHVIYEKGYGVRSLQGVEKVDTNTLFGIASNTKAFTAAALGILVDRGMINWDDKVIDFIPEFKMYDPYVTSEFTIRDLLSHHSGLEPSAGDLMHDPDSSDFTIRDIIHSMRFLKPVSSFRSRFAYSNNMYIVAGEVITRVSGSSWETFVKKNILAPLQMDQSVPSYAGVKNKPNIIDGHSVINGTVSVIPRYSSALLDPAGGMYSSVADMSKWVIMLLNGGKYGDSLKKQVFRESIRNEMWSPQTILQVRGGDRYNTHFGAYGLGWFLDDIKGYKQVFHTGQDEGMVSEVAMLPELKLGIIVLTNQESGGAFNAIVEQIRDGFIGVHGIDHVKEYADRMKQQQEAQDKLESDIWKEVTLKQHDSLRVDLNSYTGLYHDNWFGDVLISIRDGQLWFTSKRSPQLTGIMHPYKGNSFVIKWRNPTLNADVFAIFCLDEQGKAENMTLKPISGSGYDFQDLYFQR
jgi:CubicO group peptidase (beta-lactamase class C family)